VSQQQQPDPAAEAATDDGSGAVRDDFLVFLASRADRTVEELTTGLAEVITAVQATKRPGRLTYTIEVQPAKGIDGMVLVRDAVGVKPPKTEREPLGMFYVHDGGSLAETPPGQAPLFARPTTGGAR
jgi:hypothetical protein